VGDRFNDLAHKMKDRYDANTSFGDEQKEEVHDALHKMGDALDAGFTALGDALRDPTLRDELKHAGVAIADALAATFNDVADEIRKAVRR
jgi:hypothetical protein